MFCAEYFPLEENELLRLENFEIKLTTQNHITEDLTQRVFELKVYLRFFFKLKCLKDSVTKEIVHFQV